VNISLAAGRIALQKSLVGGHRAVITLLRLLVVALSIFSVMNTIARNSSSPDTKYCWQPGFSGMPTLCLE
jgi:hypothetical protein